MTEAPRHGGDNLLAVRVLNPTNESIDGVVLNQTPHRCKKIPISLVSGLCSYGAGQNYGGIISQVEMVTVPAVRMKDVFVRPDRQSGDVRVSVTLRNDSNEPAKGDLVANIGPALSGEALNEKRVTIDAPRGDSVHEMKLHVDSPHPWGLDDPFLYVVNVRSEVSSSREKLCHERSVRCGFRDFRVVDGYFHLNGKRIFLRSSHTGNHYPATWPLASDSDFVRRDLIMAKASGFNMIRWLVGIPLPEQVDFCDEIGLMMYIEHQGSWFLEDSPDMARRYDSATREMILRDRNHPSVTIWGLLNETHDGPVFRHAVEALKLVRSLDDTRLVALSSGRYDYNQSIGSVSNPGSDTWEHVWGGEAPGAPPTDAGWLCGVWGLVIDAGDAHIYPPVPQSSKDTTLIRNLGKDIKPVFLSEYGIGSLMNVVGDWRCFQQSHLTDGGWDTPQLGSMAEKLQRDWKRLGMEDVYPFPEDMLLESQRLHCRQRLLGFNAIRSNPKICGYNLTGLLDHGLTGEGLWTFYRRWKPGVADALCDGWAPLRWCLFVDPMHAYSGRTTVIEAVLANEDVLEPGDYRVRLTIFGPEGNVWKKALTLHVPEDGGGFAIPVFKGKVRLSGPAGRYSFAAEMDGAAPTGGRLHFHLSDTAGLPALTGEVTTWGIDRKTCRWLEQRGLACRSFKESVPERGGVILVGDLSRAKARSVDWKRLMERVEDGAVAVFLCPASFNKGEPCPARFGKGEDGTHWLPLAKKGKCYRFHDWLYHREWVAKRHPIFEGLQAPGVMDWDYYDQVLGHYVFEGQAMPDDLAAVSFATGNMDYPGGYGWGTLLGAYNSGDEPHYPEYVRDSGESGRESGRRQAAC